MMIKRNWYPSREIILNLFFSFSLQSRQCAKKCNLENRKSIQNLPGSCKPPEEQTQSANVLAKTSCRFPKKQQKNKNHLGCIRASPDVPVLCLNFFCYLLEFLDFFPPQQLYFLKLILGETDSPVELHGVAAQWCMSVSQTTTAPLIIMDAAVRKQAAAEIAWPNGVSVSLLCITIKVCCCLPCCVINSCVYH